MDITARSTVRRPPLPGATAKNYEQGALIPERLADSELGEIPEVGGGALNDARDALLPKIASGGGKDGED